MGIGGGFILVPIMIYLLRVPTSTVIGTSMVLTLVTMLFATMLHAVTNHLVDAVLALILMVGGVTGAQFGARAGQKIRGEQLRLLLGLLILSVGVRFAIELVIRPDDLFTIREIGGERMMRAARGDPSRPAARRAAQCRAADRVGLQPSRHGDAELFRRGAGAVRLGREGRLHRPRIARAYDLVVTVMGPRADMVTRRKERTFGIWINTDYRQFLAGAELSGAVRQPPLRCHHLARDRAAAADRARTTCC